MEYLAGCQARVISVYKFMQNRNDLSADSVMLTFDDGNLSDFEIAFPILRDFDFTAHFFVTTDFVSKKNHMDWPQIRELQKNGFIIGSHAVSHKDLSRLQDKDVIYELSYSKSTIEDKLGREVDIVSMPHGGYDHRICRIAKEFGYRAIFTSRPTYQIAYADPYVFGRFAIKNKTDFRTFCQIISADKHIRNKMLAIFYFKKIIKGLLSNGIREKLQKIHS